VTGLTLPSGATCVLRDPAAVSERARRPVNRLQTRIAGSEIGRTIRAARDEGRDVSAEEELALASHPDAVLVEDLNDALIVALVAEWSHPAPVTLEGILDIPGADYDALRRAVAPMVTDLVPDFTEPDPAPGSPTEA
jgi:hypothetical protein